MSKEDVLIENIFFLKEKPGTFSLAIHVVEFKNFQHTSTHL